MNICGPHLAGNAVSSECRRPHVEGVGEPRVTTRKVAVEMSVFNRLL